ncbi:MAG: threonine--tRNA ligase [Nitrospirae bacterium]|nr:threonine--tRNA ligase [Nitrospirota bacterium]
MRPLSMKRHHRMMPFLFINMSALTKEKKKEAVSLDYTTKEGIEVYRHSASHIMAEAVKKLFPDARLAIGPAIEDGFYYDFDVERPFTPEDLEKIEKRMLEIIKRNAPFVREEMSKKDAIKLFESKGEVYKVELINELSDDTVSIYRQGDFADLCRGPHVPSTGKIKAFKLLSTAGAYWRGSEKNKMLQRIYGTAFLTKEEIELYLKKLEEIRKRDHRRLGKELDLFSINEDAGGGLILWHPKGAVIRKTIEDFWRNEHYKNGYDLVYSPHMARLDVWRTSGHWDFYRENMYSPMTVEDVEYEIKPMNCPFHIMIYKSHKRSYRELPIKFAELGTVYRYERSGVLHGLMRVRGFTQDDAHIFCRPNQLEDEILKILDFTLYMLKTFGFTEYDIYLSTMPEKHVGTLENWEKATNALRLALEDKGLKYEIDPGEGVFYGPKIDLKIKDVLGRAWQCTTIQVDFNLPERFDVTYTAEDNKPHQTIMIHRALMGSLERFFGVLIEHYAGAFPVWLSPVQAVIMTITDRQIEYTKGIAELLKKEGIRTESDFRGEKIGFKIREAQLMKAPYMLIIGDKEVKAGAIAVRTRKGEDLGQIKAEAFLARIKKEIEDKTVI